MSLVPLNLILMRQATSGHLLLFPLAMLKVSLRTASFWNCSLHGWMHLAVKEGGTHMAHLFEVSQGRANLVEGFLLLAGLLLKFLPVLICTERAPTLEPIRQFQDAMTTT